MSNKDVGRPPLLSSKKTKPVFGRITDAEYEEVQKAVEALKADRDIKATHPGKAAPKIGYCLSNFVAEAAVEKARKINASTKVVDKKAG